MSSIGMSAASVTLTIGHMLVPVFCVVIGLSLEIEMSRRASLPWGRLHLSRARACARACFGELALPDHAAKRRRQQQHNAPSA